MKIVTTALKLNAAFVIPSITYTGSMGHNFDYLIEYHKPYTAKKLKCFLIPFTYLHIALSKGGKGYC